MNPHVGIGITGTGSYVPGTVVTNEELALLLQTEPDAIYRVTGIRARRLRNTLENIYVMGAAAGLRAIEDARLAPADIDAIFCSVDMTGELSVPAAANLMHYLMGLPALQSSDGGRAPNFCPTCDVIAGCCSPLFALEAAVGKILTERLLRGKRDTKVLVVAGDSMSNVVDWRDRETAMVFSDGIGAVVVEDLEAAAARGGVVVDTTEGPTGFLSFHLASDGAKADTICQFSPNRARLPTAGLPHESLVPREYVRMKGAEVYRHAVRRLRSSLKMALERAGLNENEIDLYVPHQANLQILRRVFEGMIPDDPEEECDTTKVYTRGVIWEGNCSAGTIFIALDKLHRSGRLWPGMTLAMPSFGAGMTWGTVVMRWHKRAQPRLDWDALEAAQRSDGEALMRELHARYTTMVDKMRTPLTLA